MATILVVHKKVWQKNFNLILDSPLCYAINLSWTTSAVLNVWCVIFWANIINDNKTKRDDIFPWRDYFRYETIQKMEYHVIPFEHHGKTWL